MIHIEQLYTGCLAEAAYYLESEGEAAIIDPLRETQPYLDIAHKTNAHIKYVFETHFHADFVSGHIDLANKTGAKIVFGPGAEPNYKAEIAKDGQVFSLGTYKIKVLHTPGHTPESACYLLIDENGKEHAIFTGDTLFVGEVGRPDLAVKSDLTVNELAGMLYDSLHNKLMTLPDDVLVYPAHGAGSSCGKNIGKDSFSTIGNQKKLNYALQPMTKEEFIVKITDGMPPPPQYFPKNANINKSGYDNFEDVLYRGMHALSCSDVFQQLSKGSLLLDTRKPMDFHSEFIRGSINIGLDGSFAIWVGTLITDMNRPIVIIAEEGREEETVKRLARVGYDNTVGYLYGGIEAWKKSGREVDSIRSILPNEFTKAYKKGTIRVIDVRKPNEYNDSHVENGENFPLDKLSETCTQLDKNEQYFVHCKSGYRSMIAASILRANGFKNIIDVSGGFDAISKTGINLQSSVPA